MSRIGLCTAGLVLALAHAGCTPTRATSQPIDAATPAALLRCAPSTAWRLYFGLDTPDGPLSETVWQGFVDREIAPRLPVGFTLWVAAGGWRGGDGVPRREDSRVLEVVGDTDDAAQRHALAEIVARYKTRFGQQSVLVTQSPVRACG